MKLTPEQQEQYDKRVERIENLTSHERMLLNDWGPPNWFRAYHFTNQLGLSVETLEEAIKDASFHYERDKISKEVAAKRMEEHRAKYATATCSDCKGEFYKSTMRDGRCITCNKARDEREARKKREAKPVPVKKPAPKPTPAKKPEPQKTTYPMLQEKYSDVYEDITEQKEWFDGRGIRRGANRMKTVLAWLDATYSTFYDKMEYSEAIWHARKNFWRPKIYRRWKAVANMIKEIMGG